MKRKSKFFIVLIIILISIIIGGILAVVLNSDDDKDKEKSNKQKNIEWGDVYLKILEDESNFEDMEDLSIQIADLNEDEIPEMIVYGTKGNDYLANIYSIDKNKKKQINVKEPEEFSIQYLYNKEENDNSWYLVSDEYYYDFELENDEYVKEENSYTEEDFEEVNEEINKQIEFDKDLEKEEIKEVFVKAQDNYVPCTELRKSIPINEKKQEKKIEEKETKVKDKVSKIKASKIGIFTKYNDETYYWQLSENSREKNGVYGNYSYKEATNKLMKIDKDNKESVVYEGNGCGEIVVVNDKIYTYKPNSTSYSLDIISINLKDNTTKTYKTGKIEAVIGENIICSTEIGTNSIFSISVNNDEIKNIKENVIFVGADDNTVYYQEDYYTSYKASNEAAIKVGAIVDGQDKGIVFKLLTSEFMEYDSLNFNVEQMIFDDDNIYILYGCRNGSANLMQEAKVVKVTKNDWSITNTLKDMAYMESLYLYKDGNKKFLIYEDGKAIDIDTFELTVINLEVENVFSSVYISYADTLPNSIKYTEESTGKAYTILNNDELKSYGFNLGDEYYTSIYNYSIVDDDIYIVIDNGIHNSVNDIGWRYSYDRTKTIIVKYNIKSGEKTKILEF